MTISLAAEGSKCKTILNGASSLYSALSDVTFQYNPDDTVSVYIKTFSPAGYRNIPIASITIGGVVITSQAVFDTQVAAVFPNAGGSAITTLTTTGTSGAATLSGGTLNIPVYADGGGFTTFATYAALVAGSKTSGTIYLVTADENNAGQMVLYFYDGSQLKSIMTS